MAPGRLDCLKSRIAYSSRELLLNECPVLRSGNIAQNDQLWVLAAAEVGNEPRARIILKAARRSRLTTSGHWAILRNMVRIIILNGVSSIGKTSIAQALQRLAVEPMLHVQGDAFLNMMPHRLWGRRDGIIVTQQEIDGIPSVEIEMGACIDRLMRGMRASVAALASAGNSLIVDDMMLSPTDQKSYFAEVTSIPLHFVGMHAPLPVLEQRERERGDRLHGLARWQLGRVHKGIRYDYEIDTSEQSPIACAKSIGAALNVNMIA